MVPAWSRAEGGGLSYWVLLVVVPFPAPLDIALLGGKYHREVLPFLTPGISADLAWCCPSVRVKKP